MSKRNLCLYQNPFYKTPQKKERQADYSKENAFVRKRLIRVRWRSWRKELVYCISVKLVTDKNGDRSKILQTYSPLRDAIIPTRFGVSLQLVVLNAVPNPWHQIRGLQERHAFFEWPFKMAMPNALLITNNQNISNIRAQFSSIIWIFPAPLQWLQISN